MNLRLRTAALSAIAIATAGLLNVTGAAPARAAEGQTCKDPVITGTIERTTVTGGLGIPVVVAEFNQTGRTDANCPAPLTNNRYKVTFTYDGKTVSSYQSEIEPVYRPTPLGLVRDGTQINFPTLRLPFSGYKNVTITVTSGSKSVFSSVWCRSDEETYDDTILAAEWGGYDTLTGVPRGRVIACP